jgi:hypothetical protein
MKIVCLEQGDWVKPTDYPSNFRDSEARQMADFSASPNRRAGPADYPVNEDESPIKVVKFNGVGGATILYAGHYPRFHLSDFRLRTLDGVADDAATPGHPRRQAGTVNGGRRRPTIR